jgi:HlyD family secretion protein
MRRKIGIAAALVGVTTLSVGAFYVRRGADAPQIVTEAATMGPVVSVIAATGTLQAVTTVQVGSQVSGTVEALNADFNSIVRKGQVLARLDKSTFEGAAEQARANLAGAQADADRLRVAAADAAVKLQRARELSERQLIPAADRDTAEVTARLADAQVRSADAQVTQARAALMQAQVNLEKTVITSPIDGIVISRDVDVGQTVAASFQAPTLFKIAADLTRMQLNAAVDESDVSHVRAGSPVTFTVDAYPGERFTGTVAQVRLNPEVVSNVVTYAVIVDAPNPSLKLKPGMTANATFEVARRENVLRVPAAALRFRPSADVLLALGAAAAPGGQPQGTATLWQRAGRSIAPVRVRVGVSDGTYAEVLDSPIAAGTEVVTRVVTAGESTGSRTTGTSSPLMPSRPPGPPPR